MRAIDTTRRAPVIVAADQTITEAANEMDRHGVGAIVVVDGNQPVGIVTDRDIAVRAVAKRLSADARVDAIMTTEPMVLDAGADLRDALEIFRAHAVRRIPLVDDSGVVGLISADDLLVDLAADLADVVRPITGQVLFAHPEPQAPAVPA